MRKSYRRVYTDTTCRYCGKSMRACKTAAKARFTTTPTGHVITAYVHARCAAAARKQFPTLNRSLTHG